MSFLLVYMLLFRLSSSAFACISDLSKIVSSPLGNTYCRENKLLQRHVRANSAEVNMENIHFETYQTIEHHLKI